MATTDEPVPDGWADAFDYALSRLRLESGMDLAFGARVTPDGRRLVIERVRGARTDALQNLVVRSGTGLGGKVMVLKRPAAVGDYVHARGISHQYDRPVALEGIHSIVAVPLLTAGRVTGVLYAALRQRLGIGERAQGLAMDIARKTQRRLANVLRPDRPVRGRLAPYPTPADSRVRTICADLGSIIERIEDPAIRAELEGVRERLAAGAQAPEPPTVLSSQEREALRYAALGLGNAEIAHHMGLMPGTVKAYLGSVLRKLSCRNRIEAVNAARTLGYSL